MEIRLSQLSDLFTRKTKKGEPATGLHDVENHEYEMDRALAEVVSDIVSALLKRGFLSQQGDDLFVSPENGEIRRNVLVGEPFGYSLTLEPITPKDPDYEADSSKAMLRLRIEARGRTDTGEGIEIMNNGRPTAFTISAFDSVLLVERQAHVSVSYRDDGASTSITFFPERDERDNEQLSQKKEIEVTPELQKRFDQYVALLGQIASNINEGEAISWEEWSSDHHRQVRG